MKKTDKLEATKQRWIVWAVIALGLIVFAIPWIPDNIKYWLTIPLYALFFFVYYKYIFKRKSSGS